MKLPGPINSLFEKKPKVEYLLALLLRDEKISAVIIEESEGKIKIVGKHEEVLPQSLDKTPVESWTPLFDRVISRAEESLPTNAETSKTVFGVKDDWVEEKKIKKEYLSHLKPVCDALSLSPIGFLVISEAIAHLVQEEEGAPLNAILTEVGIKQVTVSLFRSGKILEVKHAEISESVPKTVDFLLHHFTSVEVLPTRLIIFDGDRGETLAQEFISFQWSKGLPFLHMPQVSLLPLGFDGKAVVYGAATQMGLEIVGSIIDKTAHDIKNYAQTPTTPPVAGGAVAAAIPETAVGSISAGENFSVVSQPELGEGKESVSPDTSTTSPTDTITSDNFGFVENADIALTPKETPKVPAVQSQTYQGDTLQDAPTFGQQQPNMQQTAYGTPPQEYEQYEPGMMDKLKSSFASLTSKLPAFPALSLGGFSPIGSKKFIIIRVSSLLFSCCLLVVISILQKPRSLLTPKQKLSKKIERLRFR